MKKKIIKFGKLLILFINKILSIFKLIIVPLHFYTPLTNLKTVPNHKLLKKADFSKILYNKNESIIFLKDLKKNIKYFSNLNHLNVAQEKNFGKGFGYLESIILQSILLKKKPTKILEIGSGISTFCMVNALKDLKYNFKILVIDPYINKELEFFLKDYPNISIIKKKAEDINIRFYKKFNPDFLFIDTSHAVRPLGDVDLIYNRLIPVIKNCLIHIHDIYFPYLYQGNLMNSPWFQWSETQLLYCYLSNNKETKIILDTSELFHNNKRIFKELFPKVKLARYKKGLRIDNEKNRFKPSSIYIKQ